MNIDMKTINGFSINFDFSKLIKVADLIYHDGPLLSHYVSNKGENYLFYWVDVDNEYNRSYLPDAERSVKLASNSDISLGSTS